MIYGLGAVLPRLINFGINLLLINKIPTSAFSKITQLYALVSFINIILTFGFETAFFRFATKTDRQKEVYSTTFWFLLGTGISFVLFVHLLTPSLAQWLDYEEHPQYLRWFSWIVFFDTLAVAPLAWLRLNNRPIQYSFVKVSTSTLQTLIVLAFFFLFTASSLSKIGINEPLEYPFIGNLLGAFLGVLLLLPWLKKVNLKFSISLFREMLPYAAPIMLAGLAFAVNENLDKTLQRQFLGEDIAGAYGGCYKLAVLMTLFVTAYRLGIEPFLFKKAADKDAKKTYADILLFFSIIGCVIVLGISVNVPLLKTLLVRNPEYWKAINIVPVILVANLFFGIYVTLSTWYKVTDRTKVGAIISWIGASITIFLNFFLMKKFGFMVSAWATLIAYGSMMLISYLWGQRIYRIPYQTKKITFYLILMIVLLILSWKLSGGHLLIGNLLWLTYIAAVSIIEFKSFQSKKE